MKPKDKLVKFLLAVAMGLFIVGLEGSALAQTWIELSPVGSPPIVGLTPVNYDAPNNRLIVFFPGNPAVGGAGNQVWVLTNANGLGGTPNWIELLTTGTPPNSNGFENVVYDAATNRLIVYGGCFANCGFALSNVFVLTNANGLGGTPVWSQSTVTNPQSRVAHSSVYDPANNLVISFAGQFAFFGTDQNDTRLFSNANGALGPSVWTSLGTSGGPPPIRNSHTAFYEQANNRMTIFGGHNFISTCCPYVINNYNDTWTLSNANGQGGTPTWTQLAPLGTPPPGRGLHSAVYDSVNNRMIMFGGDAWDQAAQLDVQIGDLWQLSNANGLGGTPEWTQLVQLGMPPGPRFYHSAAFDSANQRMILLGGRDSTNTHSNRVWVLDFTPAECVTPPADLVGWWPGDGNANDIQGNNDGAAVGATFAAGMVDQAFSFDDVGDHVSIADDPSLQLPDSEFAISLWFKTDSVSISQMILSKGVSDANEEYSINLSDDGSIYWDYGEEQAYVVTNPGIVQPNLWYHLVVLYSTSFSPRGRVYLNGVEQPIAVFGSSQSHIVSSGGNLYIGSQNAGVPYYGGRVSFDGLIDEVAIFSRALSVEDIAAIFNAGSSGKCKNQLAALGPARVWIGLKNSDDVGTKFDLLAEVFKNGGLVGSGQLNGVRGGSSGFNNAVLRTINLSLSSPVTLSPGDALSVKLSVRIAVGVTGHRSGTARLWFNDAAANSRFEATIAGSTSDYFLLNGFTLGAAAAPGPKKTIDVFVDRAVGGNPFKPFGTWSKSF